MSKFFSGAAASCNSKFYTTPTVAAMPDWIKVGLKDDPYYCEEKNATFGGKNCVSPDRMPDLSKHSNFMTDFLKEHPEVYDRLKNKKTVNGVTLAHCIKTGMDNPGHPHIKTCGITAGDEESYEVFKDIFDPIISARHGGYGPNDKQPTNLDINKLSRTDTDPTGRYVLTSRVRTGRSIRGFKLPPVIDFEERRKMEAVAVKGLMNLKGEFAGDYYPLNGSRSYAPKPNGMPVAKEEELRAIGNLF